MESHRLLSDIGVRPAVSVQGRDTLAYAAWRMTAADAGASAVVERGCLVGFIDESHPDTHAVRYGHDPADTCVEEVMTREPLCCFEDQPCEDALRLMIENHLRHVPVVHRGSMALVGMVSRADLCQALRI